MSDASEVNLIELPKEVRLAILQTQIDTIDIISELAAVLAADTALTILETDDAANKVYLKGISDGLSRFVTALEDIAKVHNEEIQREIAAS